jgi:hypothetical protein
MLFHSSLPSNQVKNPADSWVLANQRLNFNYPFRPFPVDSWIDFRWILLWRSSYMGWKLFVSGTFNVGLTTKGWSYVVVDFSYGR